jgi:hypothetical protein
MLGLLLLLLLAYLGFALAERLVLRGGAWDMADKRP